MNEIKKHRNRPVVAAILAGGEGLRMGGERAKAFIPYRGVPMIERVIVALRPAVGELLIIAPDTDMFRKLRLPLYPDLIRGLGPLSGLYTAFMVTGAEQIFLAACDMPTIKPELVRHLISMEFEEDALVPMVAGVEQGLLAVYRASGIERFREAIEAGNIQFDQFRRAISKRLVTESELLHYDPELESFRNINTPSELK